MDIELAIHRTDLRTLLQKGGGDLRMGMEVCHKSLYIEIGTFEDQHGFIMHFGKVFKGEPGKSAYDEAVEGGYTGTREEFQKLLAELRPMDRYPAEGSVNTVSSGGTYEAIERVRQKWHIIE